jgi:uncharacterized protein (TIGR02266 family)
VVVDDEERLRPVVDALRAAPHSVTVSAPAEACRRLRRGRRFDLLVVDIEPPALTGFEAVKAWRRRLGPDQPVLAVSSALRREHIEGMLENHGIRRLLPADVRPEELRFWASNALFPEAMRSRRAPRIPVSLTLAVSGETRSLRARAFTLSEDGMFLETDLGASPGDELELRFRLPGGRSRRDTIAARSEVVWVSGGGADPAGAPRRGLGLRFVGLDEASRRSIAAYVLESLLDESI